MSKLQIAQRKIPHFGSAATLSFSWCIYTRARLLHLVTASIFCPRETTSLSTISATEVENSHGSPALHYCLLFFSGFNWCGGPILSTPCGCRVAGRAAVPVPREPISLCHVRSYAHKLFWGARFNELLSHTAACRFWLVFLKMFFYFMIHAVISYTVLLLLLL